MFSSVHMQSACAFHWITLRFMTVMGELIASFD